MSHPSDTPYAQVFVYNPNVAELTTLDLDEFESAFLCVARHLFETFDQPDQQCWMDAFWEAEQMFPASFGATIAHAVAISINALPINRNRPFCHFRAQDSLDDPAMTSEERYLVFVLHAMRQQNSASAIANATPVCEGGEIADLLAAIERMCIITGDLAVPKFQPTSSSPKGKRSQAHRHLI